MEKDNIHVYDAYYEDYELLKQSKFFDSTYYYNNNPNITSKDIPIQYFLLHGRTELCPTSRYFNQEWYRDAYPDVKRSKMNPLIHFLKLGIDEKRNYRYDRINFDEHEEYKNNEKIQRYYNKIYDSTLFDTNYYLENLDEPIGDMDPIIHYILIGAEKGLNPSRFFNTKEYTNNIAGDKITINPLYHYLEYGNTTSYRAYPYAGEVKDNFDTRFHGILSHKIYNHLQDKVSIIIPIYNAYEETKECIRSVLLNTHINYELILINDCSTDPRINVLLNYVEDIPFVRIIQNKQNQGFVKNINMGIKASTGDVVLLNSDTIVTPRWLSQIVLSAYRDGRIATVTPISNSSDIAVQELGETNDLLYLDKNARQVNKLSKEEYIQSPTGNGFCLFIKRVAIDDVGLFDEIFGRGYGEETDFTSRAREKGWKNIRNTSVFVYHRRHASFTTEKTAKLKQANKKIIRQRHPDVYDLWDEFVDLDKLKNSLNRMKQHIKPYKDSERILYVTRMNDTEPYLDKNFYEMSRHYYCYILTIDYDENKLALQIYNHIGTFITVRQWAIDQIEDFKTFYFNILVNLKIDMLYVRHFYNYYRPDHTEQSEFMKLVTYMEIETLYEGLYFKDEELLDVIENTLNPQDSFEDIVEQKKQFIDFTDKKVAVYTAVTGNYDELILPTVIEPDFDYICYTDNPELKSNFWQIRMMEDLDLDEIRKARHYKILPHKYLADYDYTIWIDSNFDVIGDIKHYINKYNKHGKLLAIQHEERNCIYDEAEACKRLKKDSPEIIDSQVQKYKEEGLPAHNGLIASGILFRNHHDREVINIMEQWYNEVINHSRRDQISFNYVCWKNNFQYDKSDIFYFKNQYFQRVLHQTQSKLELKYASKELDPIIDEMQRKTLIIIPIYNAYEETKACIESVKKYTLLPYELVLINDCSTDSRIEQLLTELSKEDNVFFVNNQSNQGFVRNINIGFSISGDKDVVMLNSDTIVTYKWLQKLKFAAYSDSKIATVTPVSNNAGAFSVPVINKDNIIDEELGIQGTANIVEKISDNVLIDVPTGNGFCMYIKQEALRDVGPLDLLYGKGYGEENDFCMRLVNAGWKNVVDTSTYIYHNRNVSFGDEKQKLIDKHKNYVKKRHPSYKKRVNNFVKSPSYADIRRRIGYTLQSDCKDKYNRKRILYVIHQGKGGTLYTSVDLMRHINKTMDVYLLTASRKDFKLYKYSDFGSDEGNDDEFKGHLFQLASWNYKSKYSIRNPRIKEFAIIYFNILKILHIDIVHIRHLIRHSFDMPYIARAMGIPVILSFHDFYYVCPAHNLIDDKNNYCGGHCTPITSTDTYEGQCNITMGLDAPLLKPFITTWRKYVSDMLSCCSAFVTTSKSAYDIYNEVYPQLGDEEFDIIEHGRDLKTPDNVDKIIPPLDSEEPIRIVIPGNISASKGGLFIKAMKKFDVNNKLELHFIGNVNPDYHLEEVGVLHGPYKRSEFCRLVYEINPHLIGIFSIWPETYCHTLSESWSCGVPVVSMDIGALGERIHANGGGFLISGNPEKAYHQIISIFDDYDNYLKVAREIQEIQFKSTEQMADEYLDIYRRHLIRK